MPRQHTLQQRLFLLTSLLAIGVVMFMTLTFVSAQLKQDTKDLRQQLTLAAQLLSIEVELQGESSTLNALAAYPLVARACLYGTGGELAMEPTSANGSCPPQLLDAQVAEPMLITQAVGSQGTLQVHANPGATYAGLRELAAPLILIIGALIAVVLVASRSLAHAFVRPIAQLTRSARSFDPARPRFDTQESGVTEVDTLRDAFNRVIKSLTQARESMVGAVNQSRAAQDAERETRALLGQLVDLVPYLIFAIKKDGVLLFANQAVADLYDTTVKDLLDPDFRARQAEREPDGLLFAPFSNSRENEEVWHTRSGSGETLRFLVTRVPYLGEDTALVIGTDVTEEHRLQLQLQFSQRLEVIGTLAGGIAHDFNNLLTPILGYTSMLLDSDLPADVLDKLRAVETAAERARDVVHQILTFSRQQHAEPSRELLNPGTVVEDAAALMRASIPAGVTVSVQDQGTGNVRADPSQLHQVIVNLCTNAAQAIDGSVGHIEIRVFEVSPGSDLIPAQLTPATYACIEVHDDGPGIASEVINHIFEPFFTTKDVGEGSGLGLSVVHGIVTSHGGDITVESTPEAGTSFRVLLPLATQPADATKLGSQHILLVDDDESVLRVTAELLRHYNYRVTALPDPRRAVELVTSDPAAFDAVVTDHNMPELTGAELATAVRALRPDIPIILITGFATVAAKDLDGIDHKLMKPISGRELTLVIQSTLSARRSAA